MGIYDQPNSWQCGPFALKHGLLAYGIFAHEDVLAQIAGSTEALGTDEKQLEHAAQTQGCRLLLERYHWAHLARRVLARHLAKRIPVLLCVDTWDHWVTAVAADREHVVVLDSRYETVIRLEPWRPLMRRLAFRKRRRWGWRQTVYDLHPLVTRGETGLRLELTTERAHRLLAGDAAFRRTWDEQARRLLPFAAQNGRRGTAVRLDRWLADDRTRILAHVATRRDRRLEPEAGAALDHLMFAAELFDIRTDPERYGHLVADIAAMLEATLPQPSQEVPEETSSGAMAASA
jgi:hypothetical protein